MTELARTNELFRTEQTLTGLVVAGVSALMLATMGRAIFVLVIALGLSYAIWLMHGEWPEGRRIVPVLLAAILVQCVHMGEEIWSAFYRAFPRVMGAEPWSERQFVVFNAVWIVVFLAATVAVTREWRPAYVATLFLAIGGGIGNGLGHIALAIRADGYFPGLYTAPFALILGTMLLMRHRPVVKRVVAAV